MWALLYPNEVNYHWSTPYLSNKNYSLGNLVTLSAIFISIMLAQTLHIGPHDTVTYYQPHSNIRSLGDAAAVAGVVRPFIMLQAFQ